MCSSQFSFALHEVLASALIMERMNWWRWAEEEWIRVAKEEAQNAKETAKFNFCNLEGRVLPLERLKYQLEEYPVQEILNKLDALERSVADIEKKYEWYWWKEPESLAK